MRSGIIMERSQYYDCGLCGSFSSSSNWFALRLGTFIVKSSTHGRAFAEGNSCGDPTSVAVASAAVGATAAPAKSKVSRYR